MNHDEAETLLAAYALDAVEPSEVAAIEDHVESCPRCRAEVSAYRLMASQLGDRGGAAPPEIWDRIAGRLAETPPPLRLVRESARRRRAPSGWLLGVGAAAAAAAIAFLGWDVSHLDARIGHLQAVVSKTGITEVADAAALSPGNRRIELRSASGSPAAEVVLRPDGQAYLVASTLPALGADRTYQLWGLSGRHPISLGLLGRAPSPSAFRIDRRTTELMVTAEPAGGVVAPTSPILAEASVPII
jgi:anti-sigma-K factor RskA